MLHSAHSAAYIIHTQTRVQKSAQTHRAETEITHTPHIQSAQKQNTYAQMHIASPPRRLTHTNRLFFSACLHKSSLHICQLSPEASSKSTLSVDFTVDTAVDFRGYLIVDSQCQPNMVDSVSNSRRSNLTPRNPGVISRRETPCGQYECG